MHRLDEGTVGQGRQMTGRPRPLRRDRPHHPRKEHGDGDTASETDGHLRRFVEALTSAGTPGGGRWLEGIREYHPRR